MYDNFKKFVENIIFKRKYISTQYFNKHIENDKHYHFYQNKEIEIKNKSLILILLFVIIFLIGFILSIIFLNLIESYC